MFQHYVLYRNAGKKKKSKDGEKEEEEEEEEEKKEEGVEPNQFQSKLPSFPCCKSFSVNRLRGDDNERTHLLPD